MKTATASSLIKYLELTAALTGMFCYYKKRRSIWFAFAVFLLFLFSMEMLGTWLGQQKMFLQNTRLYKWLVVPALFIMYHTVFYTILKKKVIRKSVIISGAVFIAIALFENVFWNQKHYYSLSLSISIGCISVLTYTLLYFFQLLKSDSLLHFKKLMPFWFCIGLLIFYLGGFPYLTFFNSMAISHNKDIVQAYRWIFIILNYIMYLLFTLGFIWSKPKQ